jgi:hypothetical protein
LAAVVGDEAAEAVEAAVVARVWVEAAAARE